MSTIPTIPFTFEQVLPGRYKVSGFADGTTIEQIDDITSARVDVSLR